MNNFFRKWSGRCWLRLWDMEGNVIEPGHLLRLYHFPLHEPPLSNSYLWRAEKGKGRATMLVSVTTGQRIPMSRTMSTLLIKVEEPAWVSVADYTEQLRWAEAMEWGFHLTTFTKRRGLVLLVTKHGSMASFHFTADDVKQWKASPDAGRVFLTDALHNLLHPRRAQRLREETGIIPEAERAAFARKMKRKVAQLPAGPTAHGERLVERVGIG